MKPPWEQLADKLQELADGFGQALEDFINDLELDRPLCWEASLSRFLYEWKERGILVDEKERRKLYKLLGELREELVPAEELRAMWGRWKRHIDDLHAHPWPVELGEPESPEEAANPIGHRHLGHGIMRRYPPERWMHVVDNTLDRWPVGGQGAAEFHVWMAAEAARALSEGGSRQRLAFADETAEQAATTPEPEAHQPVVQLAMADDMPADGTDGDDADTDERPAGEPPFNEETMRALLRFMDPHVYQWWMRWGKLVRMNTTRGLAMLKSNGQFELDFFIVNGKPRIRAYVYRVSDARSEFEVARAIIQEFYTHDSGGWASPAASNPGPKFTADEARWYQEWQKEAFKVGVAEAAFIADLYVKGVLSFSAAADVVVSISDFLDNGFSFSSLLGALPLIPAMAFRRGGKVAVLLKFGSHELSVGGDLLEKFGKLSREYQKAIVVQVAKAANKADAKKWLDYLVKGVASGAIKLHHIATNKNWISTLRGGPWSTRFEELFKKAGMTLNDAANKVLVPGHFGPHPGAYHKEIFTRLTKAVRGRTGDKYKQALVGELERIAEDAITGGTKLNKLLTEP